jgi:hypothetical protein
MPPPPTGAEKQGDDIPESWVANWESLSGPERLWYSIRGKTGFAQVLLWLFLYPLLVGLWLIKNLSSQSASTGIKIFSGAILLFWIISMWASFLT